MSRIGLAVWMAVAVVLILFFAAFPSLAHMPSLPIWLAPLAVLAVIALALMRSALRVRLLAQWRSADAGFGKRPLLYAVAFYAAAAIWFVVTVLLASPTATGIFMLIVPPLMFVIAGTAFLLAGITRFFFSRRET